MVTLSEAREGTCRDYNHPSRPDESIVQTTNSNGGENHSSTQNCKAGGSKLPGPGSSPGARATKDLVKTRSFLLYNKMIIKED